MLTPDDIQAVRERNDETGEIRVSAGPKFLAELIARGEEEAVGLEAEAREAVWQRIYGDLALRIAQLRRSVVLPNLLIDTSYDEVERAFLDVERLVRNPFSTPDAIDGAPSTGHYDRGTSGGSSAMTAEQVAAKLLERFEEVLKDEFSSDGEDITGFARGWMGLPCPERACESPHRLRDHWLAGVEARKRSAGGQSA